MSVLVREAPSTAAASVEPPSSLADLVAPLTDADLFGLLRRRELSFQPGGRGDRYAPVANWQALRQLIEAGNHPVHRDGIRVTKESMVIPREGWTTKGKVDVAKLDGFLAAGYSVVLTYMEAHIPALGALCDEIKARTQEGSFIGVVVTSGSGGGAFKTHFDPEDLLIVQVEGTKRWQIFSPTVPNPLRTMPKQTLEGAEVIFDEVLEPGDLLFVPGGYWHHCESGLSTSVHLGIFFLPPTGFHAVNGAVRALIAEEFFRRPLTRLDGPAARDAMEAEIKSRVIQTIRDLSFDDFVAGWSKVAF